MFLLTTRETLSPLARFCFCTFLSAAAFGLNSGVVYSWPAIGVLQFFFFILVLFCFVLDSALPANRARFSPPPMRWRLSSCSSTATSDHLRVAMPPALVLTRGFGWKKSLRDALVFLLMILAYRPSCICPCAAPGQGTGNVSELLERTGRTSGHAPGLCHRHHQRARQPHDFRNKFPWAEVPLLGVLRPDRLAANLHPRALPQEQETPTASAPRGPDPCRASVLRLPGDLPARRQRT